MGRKESHAALPRGEDMLGVYEIVGHKVWLLDDKVQASTDKTSSYTPPERAVDDSLRNNFPLCIPLGYEETYENGNNVHQTIPVEPTVRDGR